MEELSRRFILRQFLLQSALHTSVVGCSHSMGQTLHNYRRQPLLINHPLTWMRIWMYVISAPGITPNLIALQGCNTPVIVRVDNITYPLLGYPFPLLIPLFNTSNLTNTVVTPTQTQLTAEAGPMQFNLTFLNPIEVRTGVTYVIYCSYFRDSLTIGSSSQSHSHTCQ